MSNKRATMNHPIKIALVHVGVGVGVIVVMALIFRNIIDKEALGPGVAVGIMASMIVASTRAGYLLGKKEGSATADGQE